MSVQPSLYLAASYQRKWEIHGYRRTLQKMGFRITSKWTLEEYGPNIPLEDVESEQLAKLAVQDLDEIERSDALVVFTQERLIRPGHQVELGYGIRIAHAVPILFRVFICGPKNTIFCYLPGVTCVEDFDHLKTVLRTWSKSWNS